MSAPGIDLDTSHATVRVPAIRLRWRDEPSGEWFSGWVAPWCPFCGDAHSFEPEPAGTEVLPTCQEEPSGKPKADARRYRLIPGGIRAGRP